MNRAKSYLLVLAIAIPGTVLCLFLWIAILLLANHLGKPLNANAVFNTLLMMICVLVLLPLLHRGLYRTLWKNDQRIRAGLQPLSGTWLDGNQPMPPAVPPARRTPGQTAACIACYALGVPALLWLFLPLRHATLLLRFIGRHSSGTASAGSLLNLLVGYLPMVLLLLPLGIMLNRDQRAVASGTLSAGEELRVRTKMCWLFAFAGAFAGTVIFCQLFGSMVVRFL